jgi:hypothetical protein
MADRITRALALGALLAALSGACGAAVEETEYFPSTPSPAEAEWERYHALERAGGFDEALAGYRAMCEGTPPYERACYDLSRLLFELDRHAEGRAATASFLTGFPENPLAQPAVKRLSRHHVDSGTVPAGIGVLGELADAVRGSDAEDSIRYQLARLHREAGHQGAEARELQRILKAGRWESQLWDDAIWRLIEIRREQEDQAAEERLLRKLLDTREESRLIGSHNSPYHDDALLRLGQLRLEQGEEQAAYRLFMELWRWETSRMRDDGLLWAAKVRLAQGRTRDACKLLGRLIEKVPDGGAVREARDLRENRCR